jgi:hypothetical protein
MGTAPNGMPQVVYLPHVGNDPEISGIGAYKSLGSDIMTLATGIPVRSFAKAVPSITVLLFRFLLSQSPRDRLARVRVRPRFSAEFQ